MPEEKPKSMGLGKLGLLTTAFSKKFRWTFQLKEKLEDGTYKEHSPFFIKLTCRPDPEGKFPGNKPDLSFIKDEDQRKRLQNQVVQFSFVSGGDCEIFKHLYEYVAQFGYFAGKEEKDTLKVADKYEGVLTLYDGCGMALETWTMKGIFPISINFGDLDFSSSEECTIEVTLVYQKVQYKSHTAPPTEKAFVQLKTRCGDKIELTDLPYPPVEGKTPVKDPLTGMVHWITPQPPSQ